MSRRCLLINEEGNTVDEIRCPLEALPKVIIWHETAFVFHHHQNWTPVFTEALMYKVPPVGDNP